MEKSPGERNDRRWPLGLMIVCGYEQHLVHPQLAIANRLGASHIELYPRWSTAPPAAEIGNEVRAAGLVLWSAHGPWGNESFSGGRVDLAAPDPTARQAAVGEVCRAIRWLGDAGGRCLVVHPGVLSDASDFQSRRGALVQSLRTIADCAAPLGVCVCVENLPRGAFPGSRTADNVAIVREIGGDSLALCLDTGHAHIVATVAAEARTAGPLLRTTHVHDNDGQRDSHWLPGHGTIPWPEFRAALDEIDYAGVLMLECPRYLRDHPELINDDLAARLREFCHRPTG